MDDKPPIVDMKGHLISLRDALHSIHEKEELIDSPSTLKELSLIIQELENEAQFSQRSKQHKETCELVHHLLFTPWGAPFVMDSSLLEASQQYKFQEHKSSNLYHFVKDFIRHPETTETQVFKALDDAIQKLEEVA